MRRAEVDELAKALGITGCWPVGDDYDYPNIDDVHTLDGEKERYRADDFILELARRVIALEDYGESVLKRRK